mmetsp:Transcript_48091/g.55580  ORF Transcript_48091/g.55580 Transcript_48091/m.55580 type:complete len:117 (-) Transcript_48091:87-437(-)
MGAEIQNNAAKRIAKVKKLATIFLILSVVALISGFTLFKLGKTTYIFKLTGVLLLFASSVLFFVGAFILLHEREKHKGAYNKPAEELKKEARENEETVPAAVEKGHQMLHNKEKTN